MSYSIEKVITHFYLCDEHDCSKTVEFITDDKPPIPVDWIKFIVTDMIGGTPHVEEKHFCCSACFEKFINYEGFTFQNP